MVVKNMASLEQGALRKDDERPMPEGRFCIKVNWAYSISSAPKRWNGNKKRMPSEIALVQIIVSWQLIYWCDVEKNVLDSII